MALSIGEIQQRLTRASPLAQRFTESGDMGAFREAVDLLLPILSSPYKIPAAAMGIALLCETKAKELLFEPLPDRATTSLFFEAAVKYFKMAAAMPDDGAFSPARANVSLAALYDEGFLPLGVPEDPTRPKLAFPFLLKAANADFAEAQMSVANWYYSGHGVEQSFENALLWMKKAQQNKGQLSAALQAEVECGIQIIAGDLKTKTPPRPQNTTPNPPPEVKSEPK